MEGTMPQAKAEKPPVELALERLTYHLEATGKMVEELYTRLEPVMGMPSVSEAVGQRGAEPGVGPLAARLSDHADGLQNVHARLLEIRDRLTI